MKRLLLLIIFCCSLTLSAQTDIYVSSAAVDDSGDGHSWSTAKRTIAAALSSASLIVNSDVIIHVMVGYYELPEELVIPDRVTVRGGYLASSTDIDLSQQRNPGGNSYWGNSAACTILSGQQQHRLATVLEGGGLEACVLRDGKTNNFGGGVLIQGGSVYNCVITNCVAHNQDGTAEAKGGGVYILSGQLNNCVVCYNYADNGYGVAGMNGSAINNTITQNYRIP